MSETIRKSDADGSVRVEADRERCVGAGMCVMAAAAVFDQDPEDGRVILRTAELDPEQLDTAREAVALCPSGALSLSDESTESEKLAP